MAERQEERRLRGFERQREPFGHERREKRPDGLLRELDGVVRLGADAELSRFEADDVEQVAHEPIHSSGGLLNALDVPRRFGAGLAVRDCTLRDDPCAHRDVAQHVSEIVADHRQKIVSRCDRRVCACALEKEPVVGRFAFEMKEGGERASLFMRSTRKSLVGDIPLAGDCSVLGDAFGRHFVMTRVVAPDFFMSRLLDCALAKGGLGALAGQFDHTIGIRSDGFARLRELRVGFFAPPKARAVHRAPCEARCRAAPCRP